MVILWTLITLVWRKKTPKLKKKPSNFNIINIDIRRIIKVIDVYVIWADISISNTKKIILKISIIITKEGKTSKKKKKSLNYLVNSKNNNYNNKSTLKYTRNEDHPDSVSNYNEIFDFEDERALIYQRNQNNNNNIIKKYKFIGGDFK